jgi:hypothetical protein
MGTSQAVAGPFLCSFLIDVSLDLRQCRLQLGATPIECQLNESNARSDNRTSSSAMTSSSFSGFASPLSKSGISVFELPLECGSLSYMADIVTAKIRAASQYGGCWSSGWCS